jgi:hypothetical protein
MFVNIDALISWHFLEAIKSLKQSAYNMFLSMNLEYYRLTHINPFHPITIDEGTLTSI